MCREALLPTAMTASRPILTMTVVVTVLLAGCATGLGENSPIGGTPSAESTPSGNAPSPDETGTLAFYVSDQQSVIDQFESLNVTVTAIGVHPAGPDEGNTTTTPNGTATPAMNGTQSVNATVVAGENASDTGGDWVTLDVDNQTVDLTELQGMNASRITNATIQAGQYTAVYVEVSNVTGVLTTGKSVNVMLPSQRLRLNLGFAIGANRTTPFVFDVAVHRAGGSGKYVLRPVIGQSGPDVPIRSVGRERTDRPSDASTPAGQEGSGSGGSNGQGGPPTGN